MKMEETGGDWLKSKEVEKALKISSCDLMHMRLEGKLRFEKKGNAYLYNSQDVMLQKNKGARKHP